MPHVCPLCGDVTVAKHAQLMTHIRLLHADDPNFLIQCNRQGCKRTFRKFTVYKNHVYTFHDTTDTDDLSASARSGTMPDHEHTNFDMDESDQESEHERCETITEGDLKRAAAKWILRHREAHRIPHSVMESIVSGAKSLYDIALLEVRHQVIQAMKDAHTTADAVTSVSSVFDTQSQYTCVFKGLETTHKQNAFIKDTFSFVEPVPVLLGTRTQPGKFLKDGTVKETKDTLVYIPVLKTLEHLLQNEMIVSEIERGHTTRQPEVLKDFCDGRASKDHSLFSVHKNGLQILLYFDDIEVVNNLGSHKKVHKLGVFYFTLGNLRPKYRSQYSSIYLLAICKRKLITMYSMSAVLRPMVEDFKVLEKGHTFDVRGHPQTYYGTIAVVSADNPASNGLGGFKESVTAHLFCRQCTATNSETKHEFDEKVFTLRTREQHLLDCDELEADDTGDISMQLGINSRSILFELQHFQVETLLPDVMHDLLEGTLQFEAKLILRHVITERYISYPKFARLLAGLELGYMEADNRPSEIASGTISSSEKTLGQKAAQMWLLGRVIPFLVGEDVPEEDEKWKNYVQLMEIVDLLMAPAISEDEVAELGVLIHQHHTLFAQLYGNSSVLPKHHFMIHMPRLILKYGPLVRHWTMRYEAKHNHLKKLAQNIGNFINIAWTLASRHQYWQCYKWQEGDVMDDEPEIGPGDLVASRSRPCEISVYEDCFRTSWIRRDGVLFKPGCMLTLGVENDDPSFGRVEAIYTANSNTVYFHIENYPAARVSGTGSQWQKVARENNNPKLTAGDWITKWVCANHSNAYVDGGMIFDQKDKKLYVPVCGYYYISSQMYFQYAHNNSINTTEAQFVSYEVKVNRSCKNEHEDNHVLFRSYATVVTTPKSRLGKATLYIGGVVKICEGGSIRAHVPAFPYNSCCPYGQFQTTYLSSFLVHETGCERTISLDYRPPVSDEDVENEEESD